MRTTSIDTKKERRSKLPTTMDGGRLLSGPHGPRFPFTVVPRTEGTYEWKDSHSGVTSVRVSVSGLSRIG